MSEDAAASAEKPKPAGVPRWVHGLEVVAAVLLTLHCLFGYRSTFVEMAVFAVLSLAVLALAAKGGLPPAPQVQSAWAAHSLLITFTGLALVGMAIYAISFGVRPVPEIVVQTAVIYVAYAYLQQFLTQRYLVVRVDAWLGKEPLTVAVVVGLVFGALHLPWPKLILPTIGAGFVWTYAYLKGGRVWPIAASHAILAVGFFMLVLDHAPFRDAFEQWPLGGL